MSDNQGFRPEDLPHEGQTAAQDAAAAETGAAGAPAPQPEQPTVPLTPPTAPTVPASVAAQQAAATQPIPPEYGHHAAAHPLPPVYPATVPHPAHQSYPGEAFGLPGGAGDAGQPQYRHDADGAGQKKSGATRIAALLVAAAVVGGVAGLGGAWAGANLWSTNSANGVSAPQTVTVNDTSSVNNTTAIAAKVVPSVVTINVSAGSSGGTGSGVVLSKDGYILTNTHVVTLDGATSGGSITVTTSTGHVYSASVVGTDPTYDLAVIKLKDASGLTPISWGDSGKLNVGDETVAVGAPLGLSNSVTTGIVSALNRSIEIASSAAPNGGSQDDGNGGQNGGSPFYFDFGQGQSQQSATDSIKIAVLQTDAAINPGNSGGALVDSDGKLIGINVAIASTGSSSTSQAGSIGVGFSIPSDIAQRIADDLMKDGKATHGLLGATVADAASIQGATTTGAYIEKVTAGGAADRAGLQKGDVITSFNGAPVSDSVDLTAQVRALAGGAKAQLVYTRDGQSNTAQVTLGTFTG
ncbi:MAG TPA: trypsin-like peptidase domain-containing protein [Microbacterium sp.]|uniref:S1C family serine protease n=1 Tax=Microbacterium sp. TaxID=51671 RepID=UPI002B45C934|nr:trypsin-like peptidase domain-containing protein [Microbacterium sp.]HKT58266.1 trypsin-like peptidase domain-containing protein [Microbacterium sp.]